MSSTSSPYCDRHGLLAGSVAEGQAMLARGFRVVAYGGDLWMYQQTLRDGLTALRKS